MESTNSIAPNSSPSSPPSPVINNTSSNNSSSTPSNSRQQQPSNSSSQSQMATATAVANHAQPPSNPTSRDAGVAKRYRSAPAKTFQCRGYGDCHMVFSRSEHLARHIRYVLSLFFFDLLQSGRAALSFLSATLRPSLPSYPPVPDWRLFRVFLSFTTQISVLTTRLFPIYPSYPSFFTCYLAP